MDLGDDEDTDFETSAQELEQILSKAVFHRLSPVAGGYWRVYCQGPNEYQAVYSMHFGEHVFAISSHSMSTVVSVDEIYNSFPVHRARSLNSNQTRRIFPQFEGLLQSQNSPGSLANSQGMMTTQFDGANAQGSVQTNGATVSHSNFATANFPFPSPGDIQFVPQYHMGQNMTQDSPSGSFVSMTHSGVSPHDSIISPFLSEGPVATQWAPHSAVGNDEASVDNAASDGAAMPRIDYTGDFSLAYSGHP